MSGPGVRLGRVIGRRIFGSTRHLTAPYHISAPFRTEKISEKEVPVTTYAKPDEAKLPILDGQPVRSALAVQKEQHESLPVEAIPAPRAARGLDKSLAAQMPPTMQRFVLKGKVCVVTGGARGLGYNIAQGLAECGAEAIALLDINQELGDAAAAQLYEQCQVPVSFYKLDVRDGNAVAQAVADVVDTYGGLHVLVNAAGIADSNIKAENYDAEMFRRLIDINLTGSFLVAQACGRHMIRAGTGGSIVLIASMSGSIVNYPQEQCSYNASKAAVIQLGRSLAAEWARHNIRVNSLSPGYMNTDLNRAPALETQKKIWTSMTPQQRLGDADELNGVAVWLASDASSFTTGANVVVDGGYSVL